MTEDWDDPYCQFIEEDELAAPGDARSNQPLWVVHMSHQGRGAERGRAEGFICVGWVEAGNLRQFRSRGALERGLLKCYPETKGKTISKWVGDAYRFAWELRVGTLFVYSVEDSPNVMIGKVVGDYEFKGDDADLVECDSASIIPVKWIATVPRQDFSLEAQKCFRARHTVHSGDGHRAEVVKKIEHLHWE